MSLGWEGRPRKVVTRSVAGEPRFFDFSRAGKAGRWKGGGGEGREEEREGGCGPGPCALLGDCTWFGRRRSPTPGTPGSVPPLCTNDPEPLVARPGLALLDRLDHVLQHVLEQRGLGARCAPRRIPG